ncbi:hypothetical protein [Sandaracinus amylolyticus]|uniref:hypothetical protein n=1 Tax=Sandaracinus amylolyticus TaxID=927083 RepID=UPI0012ED5302|nr:hypothetical protein [Sandaracinus amylolyticus]
MRSTWLVIPLSVLALAGCKNTRPGTGVGEETCVPGETLIIGCAAECGIGSCEGFPNIRVCDGALGRDGCADATDTMFVQIDGNSCGGSTSCPRGRVACPPSGSVIVAPFQSFGDWSCEWEVEHRGILPPGGRDGETITCNPGAIYVVGCAQLCGVGECEGSPTLRVCDGTLSVADCMSETSATLDSGTSFRSCGGCPQRVVRCPESGRMTIAPRTVEGQICEWEAREAPHRADGTEVCSPGQRVVVGCASECGLGACEAETFLRICDGNSTPEQCRADGASYLAEDDDGCDGVCPEVAVTCPGSGAITVTSRGWGEDDPFACDWSVRPAGIGE